MSHGTLDECDYGHRFVWLPDHPKRDGRPRCPHCMAEGLDRQQSLYSGTLDLGEIVGGRDPEAPSPDWKAIAADLEREADHYRKLAEQIEEEAE